MVGILNYCPPEAHAEYEQTMDEGDESTDNVIKGEENIPKIHVLAIFKGGLMPLAYLGLDTAFVNSILQDAGKAIPATRRLLGGLPERRNGVGFECCRTDYLRHGPCG